MTTHDPRLLHAGARAVRRNTIRRLLHTVFGIEHLRDGQQRVIDSVLDGKDTLAIMPTGSGKSLCYQIPAHILDGLTVVVSPLISLMKDQLEKLDALGIRAVQVNSGLSAEEERTALAAIAEARCEIVFCTPERLCMPEFVDVLKAVAIALVVVDEAHCISQWGHDFRPAYLEMAGAIEALGRPPVLALTATATEDVVEDNEPATPDRGEAAIREQAGELAGPHLKVCLKLLKDAKLLRQNRKLAYAPGSAAPEDKLFVAMAEVYRQKQERDKEALEQMVAYAVSGFCRWKLLLDYFGDEVDGFEKCCRCDNCLNPPAAVLTEDIEIRDDEFDREPDAAAPAGPAFEPGARVTVPKYGEGVVSSVAGDQVHIAFPDGEQRAFLANFVTPA